MTLGELISVSNKSRSAIPSQSNSPASLPSASDKAKLFAENVSKNSNLDDSVVSLPAFPPITNLTAQKMKFSAKDFFNKCDQIRSFLRIWSYLLKKSLMENFIFCAVSEPA